MMQPFIVLDSYYGKFIICRNQTEHAETLIKTGLTNMENELENAHSILSSGEHEPVILDIGANVGMFTVPIARSFPRATLHSFEPQRMLYNALCGSVALNYLEHVTVHNKAVSDVVGHAWINQIDYTRQSDFGMIRILDEGANQIETIRIDDMNLSRVDLIKIDVEGHEERVLLGCINTIERCRPTVMMEYFYTDVSKIMTLMSNYTFFDADGQNMLCIPNEKLDSINFRYNKIMEIDNETQPWKWHQTI
jgi:FkbM family methyltransferase